MPRVMNLIDKIRTKLLSDRTNSIEWLLILLLGFAYVLLAICYAEPVVNPDGHGYLLLAERIRHFDLTGYDGIRTPVYPALLALTNNLRLAVYIQLLMHVVSLYLIYKIIVISTSKQLMALAGALIYAGNPPVLIYARSIQTETITSFLLVLSLYHLVSFVFLEKKYSDFLACFWGALAGLCRPLFLFYPFFIIVLLFFVRRRPLFVNGIYLFLIIMIYVPWLTVNYLNLKQATFTSLAGYNLSNTVADYIEPKKDQYEFERRVFVEKREELVKRTGSSSMTAFHTIPIILKENKYKYHELSVVFRNIAIDTIAEHPMLYFRTAFKGFTKFWNPLEDRELFSLHKMLPNLSRLVQLVINLIFLVSPLLLWRKYVLERTKSCRFFLFLWIYVLSVAVIQCLAEHGENYRYSTPTYSFVIIFAISQLHFLRLKVMDSRSSLSGT